MRDWIQQATEDDLSQLDQLIAAGPVDPRAAPRPRWSAATLGEVAAFLGVQLQTVKEWRTGPNPMPGAEGRWPLEEIVRWRFAKLQFTWRGENPGSGQLGKSALENEHLEISNARELLKLRRESGEVVLRSAVKTAVAQMFHRLRGQLQPLPDILATAVPSVGRADFLFDARNRIRLFLTSLAAWQFENEVDSGQLPVVSSETKPAVPTDHCQLPTAKPECSPPAISPT